MTVPMTDRMTVPMTGPPVVDVHDVFCLHPVPDGAVAALRGLTLRVAPGEALVVHGPNGSGKTTLLRVLAGRQPVSAGRAVVAGLEVGVGMTRRRAREVARWRARRLGWVDQHPARVLRPELDVLENVALQLRLAGTPAGTARARAGDVLDRLGIAGLASRAVVGLSGGEAQRVAVCAALAHGPALVLADEPTGELDRASAEQVYRLLADAVTGAGAALVLVSHDPQAAEVADRVVRIRDGRLGETWRPGVAGAPGGGAAEPLLVVDERGWVRIPERLWSPGPAPESVTATPAPAPTRTPDPAQTPSALPGVVLRPAPAFPRDQGVAVPEPGPELLDHGGGREGGVVLGRARGVGRVLGGRVVLHDVDLDAVTGRVLVVRGPSGTGKSTLLRILTGLDRPDTGSVELDGENLAGLDRAGLARVRHDLAAVVGQDVRLAETVDARGNLELARAVRGLPADPDGDDRRLTELGLGPLAGRPARMLSGGERQRLAVARALTGPPRLLVLDEPSAQLDEARSEELAGVLRRAARNGCAVVVTSHDPTLVAVADDVLDLTADHTADLTADLTAR
jgi:ABC-type lipoprotein export system ATPase subunit